MDRVEEDAKDIKLSWENILSSTVGGECTLLIIMIATCHKMEETEEAKKHLGYGRIVSLV